jgi:hypothetical protein
MMGPSNEIITNTVFDDIRWGKGYDSLSQRYFQGWMSDVRVPTLVLSHNQDKLTAYFCHHQSLKSLP